MTTTEHNKASVSDIVIVAPIIALILVVGAFACASYFGVPLPEWSGVSEPNSQLEGRQRVLPPEASAENIFGGSFQSELERYISDHIPLRDVALLANAKLQRTAIKAANLPFNWPACPTKFNSGFSLVNDGQALVAHARTPSKKNAKAAHSFAKAINDAAAAHPDVRFVYDLLDDTYSSPANPTHALTSKSYKSDWHEKHIRSRLDDSVQVIYDPIESETELYEDWFATEHHWNLRRALESHNKIGALLNWKPVEYENPELIEGKWYGASARNGLDIEVSDSFYDLPTEFDGISCTINGKQADRGLREKIHAGGELKLGEPIYNFYHTWFGGPAAEIIFENPRGNGKTCLFVEQSYGVAVERYIAANYSRLICTDPQNCVVSKSLSSLIEDYDVDDVVIQYGYAYLARLADRSPDFLES